MLRRTLLAELDYRQEAQHLMTMHAQLRGFERIVVPLPVEDYTTSRVLTMDRLVLAISEGRGDEGRRSPSSIASDVRARH